MGIIRRVLGEEHPNTLASMNNLAQTLHAEGDLAGARKIFEQVLHVSRRVLGEEHPDTVLSACNLLVTLFELKDGEAAKPVLTAYLLPLLQKDPVTLSSQLREIQSMLQGRFEPRP